jgi:Uma2 family endonuclease
MSVMTQEQMKERMKEETRSPTPDVKMSYEEFLEWCDEDTWAEWVDGEVIVLSPASDRHQDLADFLVSVLRIYAEARDLGVVRSAPFLMKLERGREPDVLFVAREHLDRLKENYLDGPADLVVEIVSPESAGRDRGEKFYEYEQAGIPEYWLLDPRMKRAEFYQLSEGQYHLILPDPAGVYRSLILPAFWLRVAWLWEEPLPRVLDVLREMKLI